MTWPVLHDWGIHLGIVDDCRRNKALLPLNALDIRVATPPVEGEAGGGCMTWYPTNCSRTSAPPQTMVPPALVTFQWKASCDMCGLFQVSFLSTVSTCKSAKILPTDSQAIAPQASCQATVWMRFSNRSTCFSFTIIPKSSTAWQNHWMLHHGWTAGNVYI